MKTMKRIVTMLVVLAMLINLVGCYGSFALTKKVYDWNGSLGNKWVNTVVMWVLMWVPVYNAAGFIDIVILNTIEFWTGSNPVAMNDGIESIKYVSHDGKTYRIAISKNQMNITETIGPDKGKSVNLSFSPDSGNWTLNDGNTKSVIATMSNNNLRLIYPNGEYKNISIPQ